MGLRILLASDHYPPFIGGAHRQTQLLAHELHQRGHQVSVATVWHPGLPALEEEAGVMVYRIKQLRTLLSRSASGPDQRHQPPFPDPVTVWRLRRLIGQLKPQVVHSHGWFSYSFAAALLGKDIPLIISARDYGYSCATRTLLYKDRPCDGPALAKCMECASSFYGAPKGILAALSLFVGRPLLLRKARGIHSVSSFVQSMIQRDLFQERRDELETQGGSKLERVIPSFLIHTPEKVENLKLHELLPAEPYILFVGELQPRKGLETLLEAYQQLDHPPPLVLIGYVTPGPQQPYPPGVRVLHNVPHAGVMAAWERCLFGVAPSIWPDPSPGVIREAMSKGKAVIGTRVGGTTEMIAHDETGLLVPSGDTDALAKAMEALIANQELRERLGCAARNQARMYSAEISVPLFEQLYQQLIARSAAKEI